MWTTSNFRAEHIAPALALLLTVGCATQEPIEPDAPREAKRVVESRPHVVSGEPRDQHIEVAGATIRRAGEDPELLRQLVPGGAEAAGAFIIDVRLDRPFGDPHRDALMAITLDGRPLTQTVAISPQRLAALVPARELASGRTYSVAVTMLGDRAKTTSRRAIEVRSP